MDMDEPLIWTREEIVRFTHDASDGIRSWAWTWLLRHHPREAGRQAARGVADPHVPAALTALLAFEAHPTPEAVKAVEELRGRDDVAPAIHAAIDVAQSGRRTAPDPREYAFERLSNAPEELKRRIVAMLLGKSDDDHLVAAAALRNQQHRWATDILLTHFAALLTSRDDTEVWATLDELRDPRSLPAILAAWVPGQRRAACLYACIHHLAGLSGPLPEGMARDIEDEARYRKKRDAFHAAHPHIIWPGVRRSAACYACGRTGEYERAIPALLERLGLRRRAGKKSHSLGESSVMVCKFCGARNADRLEPLSTSFALDEAAADDEDEDDGRDKN
jgi:hypothetical protein